MSSTNGVHVHNRLAVAPRHASFTLVSNTGLEAMRDGYARTAFTANLSLLRQQVLRRMTDPRRDIDGECGYPSVIDIQQYRDAFEREPVANRAVRLLPEESFAMDPDVYEDEEEDSDTDFEVGLKDIIDRHQLWEVCQTADVSANIGRFGIILIGVEGGSRLSDPVRRDVEYDPRDKERTKVPQPDQERRLLFLRTFDEKCVQVTEFETDKNSARYGLPKYYNVTLNDLSSDPPIGSGTASPTQNTERVHWTRVIHIPADNKNNSPVYGPPILRPIFNRVLDIRKITGAAGEMMWRSSIPGFSIEALPQALEAGVVLDPDSVKDEVANYANSLQRYMTFVGMTAKSLAPNVSDPTPHVMMQIQHIAIYFGCPMRKFMGSEIGMASTDGDNETWNKRVDRRRRRRCTNVIIRPLIDRLIWLGCVPPPEEYKTDWPDLNTPSDKDKAAILQQRTAALSNYVTGQVESLIAPQDYLVKEAKYTKKEAQAILEAQEEHQAEMADRQMQELDAQQDVLGEYGADIESQQQQQQDQQQQEFDLKKQQIQAKKKPVGNAWSDEARAAALESRRRKHKLLDEDKDFHERRKNERLHSKRNLYSGRPERDIDDPKWWVDYYQTAAHKRINPAEADAFRYYANSGYDQINRYLRSDNDSNQIAAGDKSHVDSAVNSMDNAFKKVFAPEDVMVYRGVKNMEFKEGDEFVDKGYVSTTKVRPEAKFVTFAGNPTHKSNVIMKIKVPQGFPAVDVDLMGLATHDDEDELMLPRNTRFRITRVKEMKRKPIVGESTGTKFPRAKILIVHAEVVR